MLTGQVMQMIVIVQLDNGHLFVIARRRSVSSAGSKLLGIKTEQFDFSTVIFSIHHLD